MAQHPMAILAESDLNGYDRKVFFILASHLDFKNQLAINQTELAQKKSVLIDIISIEVKKINEFIVVTLTMLSLLITLGR
ncbi:MULTISPECIES: hypothetical protein [unclassified Bartonella]|uniref:hypothetical protein n=1 Tax=unclassified Bartonella TaxID=2645622 RepID=UPI0035D134BC